MLKRLIIALPLGALGTLWFFYLSLPWPVLLPVKNPGTTSFIDLRVAQARAQGDTLKLRHKWVPLAQVSRHLRRAVIIGEDGNFYEHNGIDWEAVREEVRYGGDADFSWFSAADLRSLGSSLQYYRTHRNRIRGRSTITQQLAKNLYFSEERSLTRKVGEFLVARRLEWFLSKDRILEVYLNSVEWGPGIFGAEAAAQYYFDKPAARLTQSEAASLAATLPHPLTSNPRYRPGRMSWRRGLILARMGGTGPVKTVPLEPPGTTDTAVVPTPPDSVPPRAHPDSLPPDSVRRDSIPPDTLRSIAISRAN
jgi:monofunctional biosynthetic peptidoglycan transglycosylase